MAASRPISFYTVSLGCPKNRVDTERLLGSLPFPAVPAAAMTDADAVFINTCAFIEPSVRESIRTILDCAKKTRRRKRPFIVAGCMPGRYGVEELAAELPEVDLWLSTRERDLWEEKIAALFSKPSAPQFGRYLAPNSSSAWLKIADGCDHRCSFCAIPGIRGKFESEPLQKLLFEARTLLAAGVKELNLVAQDTASWGKDLQGVALTDLLKALAELQGLRWLRLLYLYPTAVTPELLRSMRAIGAPLLPYFDIPFQHSEAGILKRMGRPFSVDPQRVIDNVRSVFPDAALRTTLITGFPGETEADFQSLCEFVRRNEFLHLGVFPYHAEEGTRAAAMASQVPEAIREERKNILMEIQAGISATLLAEKVGLHLPILVERSCEDEWPGLFAGRVWFQAPEVDGLTYVSGEAVKIGEFVEGEICSSQTYDLSALA